MTEQGAGLEHQKPLEQAAILLLSVGESNAARILRYLSPKEVQRVGSQMTRMNDIKVDDVNLVLEQFLVEVGAATGLSMGTENYMRNC